MDKKSNDWRGVSRTTWEQREAIAETASKLDIGPKQHAREDLDGRDRALKTLRVLRGVERQECRSRKAERERETEEAEAETNAITRQAEGRS